MLSDGGKLMKQLDCSRGKRARSQAGPTGVVLGGSGHLCRNLWRCSCLPDPGTSTGATAQSARYRDGAGPYRAQSEIDRTRGVAAVSWDRRNPAVEAAIAGDLQIEDGGRHIHIQLDAEQIKEGSVGYKANSADLTFRLKLRSKGGEITVAILRSVDGTAPKTAANPTPANFHLKSHRLHHRQYQCRTRHPCPQALRLLM